LSRKIFMRISTVACSASLALLLTLAACGGSSANSASKPATLPDTPNTIAPPDSATTPPATTTPPGQSVPSTPSTPTDPATPTVPRAPADITLPVVSVRVLPSARIGVTSWLNARSVDLLGTISKIEYFEATTKIGESSVSPYTVAWTPAQIGSRSLTARATNSAGKSTMSAVVNVAVAARSGRDFYFSATGNNRNDGLSEAKAWNSISKLDTVTLQAGDRLLFEGGKTFAGTVNIRPAGSAEQPIEVTSYGNGKATIDGGAGSAIRLLNTRYVNVINIATKGLGRKDGNNQGDGVYVYNSPFVNLRHVDATGFQRAGIHIFNSSDVDVSYAHAYTNGFAGIYSSGNSTLRNKNIFVRDSRVIDNPGDPTITGNHSGNGIFFIMTSNSLIEYSEAARNGYDQSKTIPNGPVGIWTALSDHITIQYCISHDNDSPGADGGGFDLDGGTTDSVIQYSYTYNNKNYGYLFWEFGGGGIRNNTMRYNISNNDRGEGFLIGAHGPSPISDNQIYNNTVFNTKYNAVRYGGGDVTNIYFRNNVFIGPGDMELVHKHAGFRFEGNAYHHIDGSTGVRGYATLQAWADATGQEKIDGKLVGFEGLPKYNALGDFKPTDPNQLPKIFGFYLQSDSPLIDRGMDLKARFGIDPGTQDFLGNPIKHGNGFDLGAIEYRGLTVPFQATTPQMVNSGFEDGITGWSKLNATVAATTPASGTQAAVVSPNGGIWQTVTGLLPNTTYLLKGKLKGDNSNEGIYLYAKPTSGQVFSTAVKATSYTPAQVSFKTGPNQTAVQVGVWWSSSGSTNKSQADDLSVIAAP
jgi:hypothetical protein